MAPIEYKYFIGAIKNIQEIVLGRTIYKMKILKKLFRDPIISFIMIINMALIFFLIINVINIMDQTRESQRKQNQYNFNYTKRITVYPKGTVLSSANGDIETGVNLSDKEIEEFCADVLNIADRFDGNVYYESSRRVYDANMNYEGRIIYVIRCDESFQFDLVDDSTVTVEKDNLPKGVYVPELLRNIIYEKDNKEYIDAANMHFDVLGVKKNYTLDNSDTDIMVYVDTLTDIERDEVFKAWKGFFIEGLNIRFESNKSNANSNIDNVIKEYNKAGYKVNTSELKEYNEQLSFENVNNAINGGIYIWLIGFAVFNCMYVVNIWIRRKYRELVIRRTFGCGNFCIMAGIIKEFSAITLFTTLLSIVLQIIYGKITNDISFHFTSTNVLVVIISAGIIIWINMIIPLIKVIRTIPVKGLKGV